jgi:hypothetical protein
VRKFLFPLAQAYCDFGRTNWVGRVSLLLSCRSASLPTSNRRMNLSLPLPKRVHDKIGRSLHCINRVRSRMPALSLLSVYLAAR